MGSFAFTNTTASTKDVTPVAIGPVSNYTESDTKSASGIKLFTNDTAPLEQDEYLRYKCIDVANVQTLLTNYNRPTVRAGVQYQIRLDELVRTTLGDGTIVDDPLVMWLTVSHPKTGHVTADNVTEIFRRLIAACRDEAGNWRWASLAKGGLTPTVD
jgi:hypothetical protein